MHLASKIAFFLICLIAIATTLAYGTVHQPLIALFYVSVAVLLINYSISTWLARDIRISRSLTQLPILLLAVYAVIQVIPFGVLPAEPTPGGIPGTISLEPFATQVVAGHLLAIVSFYAVALIVIDSADRVRRLAAVLTVFGAVYAFYSILQSVLSPELIYGIYRPSAGIPFGSFVNRHDFAAITEMAIALPLGLIFTGSVRKDKRLLYFVAVFIMGAALMLSGSRGGLVALIAEVIFLVIITSSSRGIRGLVLKGALAALLMTSAIVGAVFVGGDTTLTRISETAGSGDVTSNRAQIWSVTLDVIRENLPLGAGLGAFPQAYARFDPSGGYERVEQAHNDYLQLVADAGIPGVLIGLLFLWVFVREGRKAIALDDTPGRGIALGALAGCFAVLVHSLFDFVLHVTAVSAFFMTVMALLVSACREFGAAVRSNPQRSFEAAIVAPMKKRD